MRFLSFPPKIHPPKLKKNDIIEGPIVLPEYTIVAAPFQTE